MNENNPAAFDPGPQPSKSECLRWLRKLIDPRAQLRERNGKTTLLIGRQEIAWSDSKDRTQGYDILEALCRTKGVDAVWTGQRMEFITIRAPTPESLPSEPTPGNMGQEPTP